MNRRKKARFFSLTNFVLAWNPAKVVVDQEGQVFLKDYPSQVLLAISAIPVLIVLTVAYLSSWVLPLFLKAITSGEILVSFGWGLFISLNAAMAAAMLAGFAGVLFRVFMGFSKTPAGYIGLFFGAPKSPLSISNQDKRCVFLFRNVAGRFVRRTLFFTNDERGIFLNKIINKNKRVVILCNSVSKKGASRKARKGQSLGNR